MLRLYVYRCYVLAGMLFCILASDGLTAPPAKAQWQTLSGRWTRDEINIDGQVVTWSKHITPAKKSGEFIESVKITKEDGSTADQWRIRFRVKAVGKDFLSYQGLAFEDGERNVQRPWKASEIQYLFQIDKNFKYEVHDLAKGVFKWQRIAPGSTTIDAQHLLPLKHVLGTFRGDYKNNGSEAYAISPSDVTITTTARRSPTGTLISFSWVSQPKGGKPTSAFEVHGTYGYDPKTGRILKRYHTSTGLSVRGTLIASTDKKLLWERRGDTPKGPMYELCLFDFSDPDTFKHVIIKRTLNGKAVDMDEQPIILKRVK